MRRAVKDKQKLAQMDGRLRSGSKRRKAGRQAGEEDPIWTREKFPECQDFQLLSTTAEDTALSTTTLVMSFRQLLQY